MHTHNFQVGEMDDNQLQNQARKEKCFGDISRKSVQEIFGWRERHTWKQKTLFVIIS